MNESSKIHCIFNNFASTDNDMKKKVMTIHFSYESRRNNGKKNSNRFLGFSDSGAAFLFAKKIYNFASFVSLRCRNRSSIANEKIYSLIVSKLLSHIKLYSKIYFSGIETTSSFDTI